MKSNLEEKVNLALNLPGSYTSGFKCFPQELWVKLFPNSPRNANTVDFYYPSLKLILEVNGEQHYRPVGFGEKDTQAVFGKFQNQKKRDNRLRVLCDQGDFVLIEIHYNDVRSRTIEELSSFIEKQILENII